jgi:hypothetical protein
MIISRRSDDEDKQESKKAKAPAKPRKPKAKAVDKGQQQLAFKVSICLVYVYPSTVYMVYCIQCTVLCLTISAAEIVRHNTLH